MNESNDAQEAWHRHELGDELHAIGGYYELTEERTVDIAGERVLYNIGIAEFDATCCGVGGCAFAVVAGVVLTGTVPPKVTNDETAIEPGRALIRPSSRSGSGAGRRTGRALTRVRRIRDESLKHRIRTLINDEANVSQIIFR